MKILNPKSKILNRKERGFVLSIITFFVLIIMLSIAVSMSALVTYRQKIATNSVKSTQSYYAAESGVEDALLRLNNSPQMASLNYNLSVNGATANVVIPNIVLGSRAITSQGNASNIIRNIQTVYSLNTEGISFHYGAQVGEGGLIMNNGTGIQGNVFSNGNISGGSGVIDNNVIVAGNGHSIKDVSVGGNVLSYSCLSPTSVGCSLTYVTGGTNTCAVSGSTSLQSEEIDPQPLPISDQQIADWKSEAEDGGVITGNFTLGNNATVSKGPVKITGDLNFGNGATLNITGTIYVQGNINFGNNNIIRLDNAYGSLGGVIIIDGTISTGNGSALSGSGQPGSYLLVLSTNISDTAINVNNNATGAIFYTTVGGISVNNNVQVKELTGYKIILRNNAIIQYDSGLANVFFSDGPGGSWEVLSWEEK